MKFKKKNYQPSNYNVIITLRTNLHDFLIGLLLDPVEINSVW